MTCKNEKQTKSKGVTTREVDGGGKRRTKEGR
jgi:hypothetical protein